MDEVPNHTEDWPADFLDAHDRHWKDGETLSSTQRLANADHLFGFSAECGLKAVMARTGMATDELGLPKQKKYQSHIDKLWDEFLTFAEGREAARYIPFLPVMNPFANWRSGQRYANHIHYTQPFVSAHRKGADAVRSVVREAQKDGLIS